MTNRDRLARAIEQFGEENDSEPHRRRSRSRLGGASDGHPSTRLRTKATTSKPTVRYWERIRPK